MAVEHRSPPPDNFMATNAKKGFAILSSDGLVERPAIVPWPDALQRGECFPDSPEYVPAADHIRDSAIEVEQRISLSQLARDLQADQF